MKINNPLVIARNFKVEECLAAVTKDKNLKPLHTLLSYLKKPYKEQPGISDFQTVPNSNGEKYITFCGT